MIVVSTAINLLCISLIALLPMDKSFYFTSKFFKRISADSRNVHSVISCVADKTSTTLLKPTTTPGDRFEIIYTALVRYKRIKGNMTVRPSYKIPSESPWSKDLWGHRLGEELKTLREQKKNIPVHIIEKFDAIGFRWIKSPTPRTLRTLELVVDALLAYKRIYGNLSVPQKFVIPMNDSNWPSTCWGYRLGTTVTRIRHGLMFQSKDFKDRLSGIGFDLSPPNDARGFEHIFTALKVFRDIHGHVLVPQHYVVKAEAPYPKATWGIELGIRVRDMRRGVAYCSKAHHNMLMSIDFVFDPQLDRRGFDTVFLALQTYQKLYGNLLVPQRFHVSGDDDRWPEETRDMDLGLRVREIRRGRSFSAPELRKKLDELGFVWNTDRKIFLNFLSALRTYRALYGNVDVSMDFVVPSDAQWSSELWGLQLGQRVQEVKRTGEYKSCRARMALTELGFEWDQTALENLETFSRLDGTLMGSPDDWNMSTTTTTALPRAMRVSSVDKAISDIMRERVTKRPPSNPNKEE